MKIILNKDSINKVIIALENLLKINFDGLNSTLKNKDILESSNQQLINNMILNLFNNYEIMNEEKKEINNFDDLIKNNYVLGHGTKECNIKNILDEGIITRNIDYKASFCPISNKEILNNWPHYNLENIIIYDFNDSNLIPMIKLSDNGEYIYDKDRILGNYNKSGFIPNKNYNNNYKYKEDYNLYAHNFLNSEKTLDNLNKEENDIYNNYALIEKKLSIINNFYDCTIDQNTYKYLVSEFDNKINNKKNDCFTMK